MKEISIFKFGGIALQNSSNILRCMEIVKKENPGVIVVSAMGKTTNQLELLAEGMFSKDSNKIKGALAEIRFVTLTAIRELFKNSQSHDALVTLETIEDILEFISVLKVNECNSFKMFRDRVMSFGEIIVSIIFSSLLKENLFENNLINAWDLVCTDLNFGQANVNFEESFKSAKSNGILVLPLNNDTTILTQGFIAGGRSGGPYPKRHLLGDYLPDFLVNVPTTLGREGSDYSTAVLAFLLTKMGYKVREVVLYKDVRGVFDRIHKNYSGLEPFGTLSSKRFRKMVEPGESANGLVHPKTVDLLEELVIILKIKSFLEPDLPGTVITPF